MEHVFLKGSLALGPALCSVVGGHQPHVTMPKIEGRAFSTSPLSAAKAKPDFALVQARAAAKDEAIVQA